MTEEREIPAPKGFDVGSAGDAFASEFIRIGYEIAGILRQHPLAEVTDVQLLQALRSTRVVSFPNLTLNQAPVDAINYTYADPPRIELSREHWSQLWNKHHEKVFLVFHEYLGILKILDVNSQVSHQLDAARVCFRTEAVRKAIEKHFQRLCYEISAPHLGFIERLDLSNQEIASLKLGDFDYLYNLSSLDLGGNHFKELPRGIFRDLKNVEELSLRGNQIAVLSSGIFSGLDSLSTLGKRSQPDKGFQFKGALGENPIRRLNPGFLKGLPALTDAISLCSAHYRPDREVSIETIENGAFAELKQLRNTTLLHELELCFDFSKPGNAGPSLNGLAGLEHVYWLRLSGRGFDRLPDGFFSTLVDTATLWLTSEGELRPEQVQEINHLPKVQYLILKNLNHYRNLKEYFESEAKLLMISNALTSFECRPYREAGGNDRDGMACSRK